MELVFKRQEQNFFLYFLVLIPSFCFLLNPAVFPADDGFFYPQIAYNIVNGKGSYFNDLYLTNGYHPLWMMVCVISEFINPFSKQDVIYILWIIQFFLALLSFKKLNIFSNGNSTGNILAYFCLAILFFSLGTLYLTEAFLNLYCLSLLVWFLAKQEKRDFAFGFIVSLVFLCRLDNVFLLIPVCLYYFTFRKWHYSSLLKTGIVLFFLGGIYLLSNLIWFGSFVPISGRVKSFFPYIQPHIFLNITGKFFLAINILYLIIISFSKESKYRITKFVFSLGSLLQLFYNILYQSQIGQWYYIPQMMILFLFIIDLSVIIFQKKQFSQTLHSILAIFLLIISLCIGYVKSRGNFSLQSVVFEKNIKSESSKSLSIKEFSENLKKTLPPKSRMFTYDFPGKLAFYSDLEIIPADGLVGNKDYFKDISELKFEDFLRKNKISYVNFPTNFNTKGEIGFIGISTDIQAKNSKYFIINALTKRIVDTIDFTKLSKVKSYENPIKTWQKEYDSVTIYQLKNF